MMKHDGADTPVLSPRLSVASPPSFRLTDEEEAKGWREIHRAFLGMDWRPTNSVRAQPEPFTFDDGDSDRVFECLQDCLILRDKYITGPPQPLEDEHPLPAYARSPETLWAPNPELSDWPLEFKFVNGVMTLDPTNLPENIASEARSYFQVPTMLDFENDLRFLKTVKGHGPVRSFCYRRLEFLKTSFELHRMSKGSMEETELKENREIDFLHVVKVDNHIHAVAAMPQLDLIRFIRNKLEQDGERVIKTDGNAAVTLKQLFSSLNLLPQHISMDALDMQVHSNAYERFDKFNASYNPFGIPTLRETFLKTRNSTQGLYFAELMRQVLQKQLETKTTATEMRLSVYGRSYDEWEQLAEWIVKYQLFSPNNRWIIQIPRLASVYIRTNRISSVQDMLDCLFLPLFQATLDPNAHPNLHSFLQQVVAIDSVDDESLDESPFYRVERSHNIPPAQWTNHDNPPYKYYMYYLKINLMVLNRLRRLRHLNTLAFRPHCGEAGDLGHLDSAFLLADGINHGIQLFHSPVVQYLFYLKQIPISMSPVSNNALFLPLHRNPFLSFFQKGLNVTLSTDDPCMFHFTSEPLVEEYSIVAKLNRLTSCDLCELARNSVLQSGFESCVKAHWIGGTYHLSGVRANCITKTNVSNIRIRFRHQQLAHEFRLITKTQVDAPPSPAPMSPIPSIAPALRRLSRRSLVLESDHNVDANSTTTRDAKSNAERPSTIRVPEFVLVLIGMGAGFLMSAVVLRKSFRH
eukprot:c17995_g1_i2.p1 GENE.c17995_g1_i2~~c17995_g1_i2.p1  ORF type:complete len:779 (+),score=154.39 c17995_g1_i2:94-2337(+)